MYLPFHNQWQYGCWYNGYMRIGTYLDQTQAMVKMCSQKFDLHMRSICTSKCFACVWAHAYVLACLSWRVWNSIKNCAWRHFIRKGKWSKVLNKVNRVRKISKNLESFLEISPMQRRVLPSYKLQDHAHE